MRGIASFIDDAVMLKDERYGTDAACLVDLCCNFHGSDLRTSCANASGSDTCQEPVPFPAVYAPRSTELGGALAAMRWQLVPWQCSAMALAVHWNVSKRAEVWARGDK